MAISDLFGRSRPGSGKKAGENDARLFLPTAEGWDAGIKQGWEREYCHAKNPGEDFFHLLMNGEVYLQRGSEKVCLNCALRRGVASRERLNWQHQSADKKRKSLF